MVRSNSRKVNSPSIKMWARCVHRGGPQRTETFEEAENGTVFLDEIGEMVAVQPKLLGVLQEKTFQRVGSSRPMRANVRVIAVTNRSLADEVEQGRFRADLYYLLNSYHVQFYRCFEGGGRTSCY